MSAGRLTELDFDVGGLARIRLTDAEPGDVGRVAHQLGIEPTEPSGEADLTVRFAARLELPGPLRLVGAGDAGYAGDVFIVLARGTPRAMVPLDEVGRAATIVVRRGVGVPHLVPILNLSLLGKGILPLHASAFSYRGRGIAAAAWSKGGKTEALLAFMAAGADLVADEWTYIAPDGRMSGFRSPIRLLAWHLRQQPELRRRVGREEWLRLAALDGAAAVAQRLTGVRVPAARAGAARLATRLASMGHVDVRPADLFGPGRCSHAGQLNEMLLLVRRDAPGIEVRPIPGHTVAERMLFAHLHHRLDLIGRYWQFRYAFPERQTDLLDQLETLERGLLRHALADRPAWLVEHPGRVDLQRLFEAIAAAPGRVSDAVGETDEGAVR